MTILFVGNSAGDFFASANPETIFDTGTAPGFIDTDFVTTVLRVETVEDASIPFGMTCSSSSDDFWLHFRLKAPYLQNASIRNDFRLFAVYDTNDKKVVEFKGNDDNAEITVYGDTDVSSSTFTFGSSGVWTFDLRVQRNSTTDVVATLYANGFQIATATAANTTAGNVALERVIFENFNMPQRTSGSITLESYFSEFICTGGESPIGWRLGLLQAASDGFHDADFEGGATEAGDNNLATALAAGTNGDKASFVPSTYNGPTTAAGIRGVFAVAVATKGDTGPGTLKQFLRIDGTDYEGSAEALTVDNAAYIEAWDDNPDTTLPWTSANLAAFEFGVKAET